MFLIWINDKQILCDSILTSIICGKVTIFTVKNCIGFWTTSWDELSSRIKVPLYLWIAIYFWEKWSSFLLPSPWSGIQFFFHFTKPIVVEMRDWFMLFPKIIYINIKRLTQNLNFAQQFHFQWCYRLCYQHAFIIKSKEVFILGDQVKLRYKQIYRINQFKLFDINGFNLILHCFF